MLILGLETSCDETAAAVVQDGVVVRSNVVATQHDLHQRYAGVVPEIASRAHLERLMPVVQDAVAQAGVTLADLDAIAVGNRPGLVGSLIVGVSAAKALAWSLDKPLIGVDHVRAHLHAAQLVERGAPLPIRHPCRRSGWWSAAGTPAFTTSHLTAPPSGWAAPSTTRSARPTTKPACC